MCIHLIMFAFVIKQVHGRTTEKDIIDAVCRTEDLAKLNTEHQYSKGRNFYTILFFDEANTTEHIGLIKEIMCDRRVKGREIKDESIKFIAACNPYRK